MMLYHGSDKVIDRPQYGLGKATNDYGRGFYCTEQVELAREWACPTRSDGIVNSYELDLGTLAVLDLNDPRYNILQWLHILVMNRPVRLESPIQEEGMAWIKEHFVVDISPYDVVRGYRADDSYFGFVRSFLENGISLGQLKRAMHLGNLGEQVVVRSRAAFEGLRFLGAEAVSWQEYHLRRIRRDEAARTQFQQEVGGRASEGLFMMDILRERMELDDARLC